MFFCPLYIPQLLKHVNDQFTNYCCNFKKNVFIRYAVDPNTLQ